MQTGVTPITAGGGVLIDIPDIMQALKADKVRALAIGFYGNEEGHISRITLEAKYKTINLLPYIAFQMR